MPERTQKERCVIKTYRQIMILKTTPNLYVSHGKSPASSKILKRQPLFLSLRRHANARKDPRKSGASIHSVFSKLFSFHQKFSSSDLAKNRGRRLSYGIYDLRRFERRCFSALGEYPRHDDLLRHFRDGEEPLPLALAFEALFRVHLVGEGEFSRLVSNADLHVGVFLPVDDVIERDRPDDVHVRREGIGEHLRFENAADDEGPRLFAQVAVGFDAPFTGIQEQDMGIDFAHRWFAAPHVIVGDAETPVLLPRFKHHGEYRQIVHRPGLRKHFEGVDEGGVQKIRIVSLEDLIHGGGDARPERFREHFFGNPRTKHERKHRGFRKLCRAVEFPAVVGEVVAFADAVIGDGTMEVVFQRVHVPVHGSDAVFRPDELVFLVFEFLILLQEHFGARHSVLLEQGDDARHPEHLHPRNLSPAVRLHRFFLCFFHISSSD